MEEHELIKNLRSAGKETSDLGPVAVWMGELESGGYPVPKGIVVSNKVFDSFLRENGIAHELFSMMKSGRSGAEISERISKMITSGVISQQLMKSLLESIDYNMEKANELGWVSLIASPSHKLLPILWNEGNIFMHGVSLKGLEEGLKEMWKLNFMPRAIDLARNDLNIILSSVIMLDPVEIGLSGWLVTDELNILIKSSFGYPKGFNDQGYDLFTINRSNLSIKERKIAEKSTKIIIERGGFKVIKRMRSEEAVSSSISEDMLIKLATLGLDVEWHLGGNIILQWAIGEEPIILLAVKRKEVEIGIKKEEIYTEKEEEKITLPSVIPPPAILKLFLWVDDPVKAESLESIVDGFIIDSKVAQKILNFIYKLRHTIIIDGELEIPQDLAQRVYFLSKESGKRSLLKVESLKDLLLYKRGFSGMVMYLDVISKELDMGYKELLNMIRKIVDPLEGGLVLAQLDEIPDVDTVKIMMSLGITGIVLRSVDEEKMLRLREIEKELLLSTISLIWKKNFNVINQ
ncbi:MAG: hypothetical protein ACUX7D_04710 [Candidatus Methanodesulfokora washburnensis]|jgi:hypothetical protein